VKRFVERISGFGLCARAQRLENRLDRLIHDFVGGRMR
jgi:hypothetical protein